jgi:hypothetical protein
VEYCCFLIPQAVAIPKGGNLTGTALVHALVATAFLLDIGMLRHTLHCQIDGGSENWNLLTVFAVAALLVQFKVLDVVYFSRLPVGHTHNDVDQMASATPRACCTAPYRARQARLQRAPPRQRSSWKR